MTKRVRRTKQQLMEFEKQVIVLRQAGLSFEEIGDKLDSNGPTAFRALKRAMERIPAQSVKELRILQTMRLEKLYLKMQL